MARLRRFEGHRYLGRRDQMVFYDTDADDQATELAEADRTLDLTGHNLLQAFAPDTPAEARNRGFRPWAN
ncbi:MAG TPA: hypothetical protein VID03_04615 [Acidimicrobiia bacterium]|jgi:hypothetical protein